VRALKIRLEYLPPNPVLFQDSEQESLNAIVNSTRRNSIRFCALTDGSSGARMRRVRLVSSVFRNTQMPSP
jgi:hypothetical protein